MGGSSVRKSISIPEELDKFAQEKEISLSSVMQDQLKNMKKTDEDTKTFRYTPTPVLKEGRKQGLITMLSGVFTLIVLFLGYLWLTTGLSAFAVAWLAGSVVTYYGAREYSKWNDILYYRAQNYHAKNSEEE